MEVWIGLVFVIFAPPWPGLHRGPGVAGQPVSAGPSTQAWSWGSVLLLVLLAGVALVVNLNSAVGSIRTGSFADVNLAASARTRPATPSPTRASP